MRGPDDNRGLMLALIVLAVVIFIAWKLWAPAPAFVRGFASLLDRPVEGRPGALFWLVGTNHTGGQFAGRDVVFVLHQRRGRYDQGYAIVAMRLAGRVPGELETAGVLREWVAQSSARDAWDDLELRQELKLAFAEGSLKATWMPALAFMFPGRFDAQRWRGILQSMQAVVLALEQRATAATAKS